MHGKSYAQCDYKIKVSSKITNAKGEISANLTNAGSFQCVLYAYEGGNKVKLEEKSGNTASLQFNSLPINGYYRLEFYFKREDKLLCSSWASELIQLIE